MVFKIYTVSLDASRAVSGWLPLAKNPKWRAAQIGFIAYFLLFAIAFGWKQPAVASINSWCGRFKPSSFLDYPMVEFLEAERRVTGNRNQSAGLYSDAETVLQLFWCLAARRPFRDCSESENIQHAIGADSNPLVSVHIDSVSLDASRAVSGWLPLAKNPKWRAAQIGFIAYFLLFAIAFGWKQPAVAVLILGVGALSLLAFLIIRWWNFWKLSDA